MLKRTLLCACVPAVLAAAAEAHGFVGAVFTQSNDAAGNEVLAYRRRSNGELQPWGSFVTGGMGTGAGLGSQGAVTLSSNNQHLLVVNAGSNDISVFRITSAGLILTDIRPSRGVRPTSVAERNGRVFVLNAGAGANSVAGFTLNIAGDLTPTVDVPSALSAASTAPAQVGFAPDGQQVVVSERMTNQLDLFPVTMGGRLGARTSLASVGATPFGFEFRADGVLIVSEAFGGMPNASAVSSYRLGSASLTNISASVPTTETAACWIVITENGRFTYTTNTGSGTITGYRVGQSSGTLTPLDADGVTGDVGAGANPIDAGLSRQSRYLYALSPATHAIAAFRVRNDGDLDARPGVSGLPSSAVGLAVR